MFWHDGACLITRVAHFGHTCRSSLNREIRVNFCDGVPHRSQGSMGLKYTEQLLHTTPYLVSLPIGFICLITSNTGLFLFIHSLQMAFVHHL